MDASFKFPSINNFFTTFNSCENEAPILGVVLSSKGMCSPSIFRNLIRISYISAVPQAHNTRFETRVYTMMMMGRLTSACNGPCCRPQIAVISGYSILVRGSLLWAVKNMKFPICRNHVYILRQFHSEICERNIFIDFSRSIAEQSDVKMTSRRHIFSDVLHTICRHPRVEVLTVTSPADEIFTNASFNLLVQDFMYFINGPVD